MTTPATALVTGAAGFLGRHVAAAAAHAGYRVVGLGLGSWEEPEWRAWGLSEWRSSEVDASALSELGTLPSAVFHCAGGASVAQSFAEPAADFEKTVGSVLAVLEFIRLHAPDARLVYPSSAAVYGDVEELPIVEEAPRRPVSPYGTHKLVAEQLCASHADHFGVRVALVRFFSLYGPGLRKQLLWDAGRKFLRGEARFLGTGEEVRDWLHVTDAARLMLLAGEHAASPGVVVNGGSGEGRSVRQVLSELRACFSEVPPLSFSSEAKAGDPVAYVASSAKMSAWGFRPGVALSDGVREYASWLQREGS